MDSPTAIAERLNARLQAGLTLEAEALIVPAERLLEVAAALRDDPAWRFDYLANLCAVDYLDEPPRLETVYHLYSVEHRHGPLTLKVRVPREDPRQPSLVSVWRSAELQEREAYDLYGVRYEGHPDLRRILMWDGFAGHPMRKDYVQEDQNELAGAEPIELDSGEPS